MGYCMTIGERLKKIREEKAYNQGEFAKFLGINQQSLSNYETNKRDIPEKVKILLQQNGVNLNWLLTGCGEPFLYESLGEKTTHDNITLQVPDRINGFVIPVLEQKLSAGYGADLPDDDTPSTYILVPKYLSKYGTNLVALYVDGDSMEPTLSRGDMIVCDSCGWTGEGIYAIQMDGAGFVKRLTRKPGKLVVISDNPIYTPYEVSIESEDIRIIGRVHGVLHGIE